MWRALALLGFLLTAVPAAAETLITSLSSHRVDITSTYTGASLVLFGSIERDARAVPRGAPYDIVVTVRGPRRTALIREKKAFGPLWITAEQRRFVDFPVFLAVATSRPLAAMGDEAARQRLRIGLAAEVASPFAGVDLVGADFRGALIRLRSDQGLFTEKEGGVDFLSDNLFRASIDLPAIAPTGTYEVETVLLAGSVLLARQSTNFEVVKTGVEQATVTLARDHSVLYGLGTASCALMLGWLATIVFRRE